MQGEILFESGMVECKAIRPIQKTPKSFPRGGKLSAKRTDEGKAPAATHL